MSGIFGGESLVAKLERYDEEVFDEVDKMLETRVKRLQQDVVADIPVHSGATRDALSSPDAISIRRDRETRRWTYSFGFLTPALRKKAFYYFWVETGRQSGIKGGYRRAGKDKAGRDRFAKLKRHIPPLRARWIMTSHFIRFSQQMASERNLARCWAAAKLIVGGKS